jgi:tetratricopeptide (TPR) repeat protein
VLANQYGDCKDKHTLLASLLDAAGIKAYPALINSSRELDPDVPSPMQFDHVITAVPQGRDYLWLDTTAEVAPFRYLMSALLDKQALLMPTDQPSRLVTTPSDLPFKPLRTFSIDAKLDDTGTLEGKIEQSIRGEDTEVMLRKTFRSAPLQQWKDLVQRVSYASGFSGEVSDVSVSAPEKTDEPWHVSYTYKRKDYPDWANHRLSPPLPPMAMPADRDNETRPTVPVWLGPVNEIDVRSQVELPKGYTPVLPTAVNLIEDFAEYHATFGIKEGKFITERHLIAKLPEIPVNEYERYKKFRKAIEDDHNAYVETSVGTTRPGPSNMSALAASVRKLPDSTNPAAMMAENDARQAAQRGDRQGTVTSFRHAVELDPKFTRDWLLLAGLQMASHQPDQALETLQKAVDSDPNLPLACKMLGLALVTQKKYDDAIRVWTDLIKLAPDDIDGHENLALTFAALKRYSEAAAEYESEAKLTPNDPFLEIQLGHAYLHADNEAKAVATYKRTLELNSEPLIFNDIGYELADANKQLPLALEYAERAVHEEEEISARVNLSNLRMDDLAHTQSLGAYWDTLGWVHFRMGNYDKAEKYLDAAWTLSQGHDEAEHLAQLHKQQHKDSTHPGADPNLLRTTRLPRLAPGTANAELFVILARDPKSSNAKVEDVKFVSGSEELRSSAKAVGAANFTFPFPDDGPSRIVRRGILSCYPVTGCNFVLYNLSDVHSVN